MKVILDEGAIMPTKAHPTDAGFDLYSRCKAVISPHDYWIFDTGVHIRIPDGFCGLLVSKSGLNVHEDLESTGLIDAGYTGSIKVKLYNRQGSYRYISKGQKISQIVILPIENMIKLEKVESFDEETERGSEGFGSSGKM